MRKEWRNRGRHAQSGPRSRDDYLPRDLPSPLRSLMDSPFVARPGFPAPVEFPRFAQLSSLATPYTYAACDVPNLCINHGTARLFRHLRDRRPPHPTGLSGCHPLRHPILPTRGSLPRSRLHRSPGQRLCRRRLQRPADSPRRDRPFPPPPSSSLPGSPSCPASITPPRGPPPPSPPFPPARVSLPAPPASTPP